MTPKSNNPQQSSVANLFDGITAPTPSSALTGTAGAPDPGLCGVAGAASAATILAAAPTGLTAAVTDQVFEGLVRDATDPVVLRTTVGISAGPATGRKQQAAATTGYRYVFACAGIVFVTTSNRRLDFPQGVREIPCLAVMNEGRQLGRDNTAIS